jgi:hypothetical protein
LWEIVRDGILRSPKKRGRSEEPQLPPTLFVHAKILANPILCGWISWWKKKPYFFGKLDIEK